MEKNPLMDEARLLLEKAQREKEESQILYINEYFEGAINRLYYSAFHLATALLILFGENPKTHSGTIQRFSLLAIDKKVFEKKFAKVLADLYRTMKAGDYTALSLIDKEEVKILSERFQSYDNNIREIISKIVNKLQE